MIVTASAPSVSVCMPTRNHARFLREAVTSVLAQTRRDFELVVYDDCSTDETPAILAEIGDPRVRVFRQPQPVGIAANRNSCVAVARGRYVAWLDSDDAYHPEALATQSAVLDAHPRVGLVHGAHDVVDEAGRTLPDWEQPFERDTIEPGEEAFRELVLSNYVAAPTVLVRRACYDALGGYAPELSRSGEDWEMWMRIALHHDVAFTSMRVARYRVHPASSSAGTEVSGERLRLDREAVARVFSSYGSAIPDAPAVRRRAGAALAFKALVHSGNAFANGRTAAALRSAALAFRFHPPLARARDGWLLLASIARRDEYGDYTHAKALLARLHAALDGSRFARKVRRLAVPDPEWQRMLVEIAGIVRCVVPRDARVASVDKHDPTLLRLSGRRGWHFPEGGSYPETSVGAIDHLEQLRRRGADYLVVPSMSFWWLDHYDGFADHLAVRYAPAWSDERCIVYQLAGPGRAR